MYDSDFSTLAAAFAGIIFFIVILVIAWLIFYLIGVFKLYKKCGKGGWEIFIPIYGDYVLTEIAGLNWWWLLLLDASSIIGFITDSSALSAITSIAGLVGRINVYYNLAKKVHKPSSWVVLSVFFGGFTLPILGYSKNTFYDFNVPVSKNGFFDKNNVVSPQQSQPMNNMYNYQQTQQGQAMNNMYNYQQSQQGQAMNNMYNYQQTQQSQPMNNMGNYQQLQQDQSINNENIYNNPNNINQ